MTIRKDIEKAVTQPWKVYRAPEDVLVDERLSDAEKRRVLESWEHDARELAVAEEENMGGGEPNMLDRVVTALNTLPVTEETRARGPATMHGNQPTPTAAPDGGAKGPETSGEDARQGEIILKTPRRRMAFIAGLILAAVVALLLFPYAAQLAG